MNYKESILYFKPSPSYVKVVIIVAFIIALMVLFSALDFTAAIITFLIISILGIFFTEVLLKEEVTDSDYDKNVAAHKGLKDFQSKALQELDLDRQEVEVAKPITISGYTFVGANQSKLGEDGLWRTDRFTSSILFFSAEAIHVYQYSFSTTTPNNFLHNTHEYFYKDVVSIDITQESTVISNNNVTVNNLNIVLSSGTSFKTAFGQKDSEQINTSIRAMRNLLKEKKK